MWNRTCLLLLLCCLTTALPAQQRMTGLLFDDDAYEAVPLKKPVLKRNYENLPANASLKAWCPQPQDQGAYANCVGWAAGYAGRTIVEALQNSESAGTAITEQAFSPDFLYLLNKSDADINCQRGISINQALRTMQEKGVPRRRDFAAVCSPDVAGSILEKAKSHRIEGYTRLFDKDTPEAFRIQIIKKALAQQKPVVVGIEAYESLRQAGEYWNGAKERFIGGHALCVVGYDEQRGAFEVMNSWGADWGAGGFTWMRYRDFAAVLKYAFELISGPQDNTRPGAVAAPEKMRSGSMDILLASGEKVAVTALTAGASRGVKVVKATTPTTGVQYQTAKGYPSGTRYRLYLTNGEPAYVYVLGSDLSGAVGQVFPPDAHTSPYLSYPGNAIALPDESWYIEMDDTQGTDFICILYSLQALDTEALLQQLNRAAGNFPDKLKAALGDRLIPAENVRYEPGHIGFSTTSSDRSILATIIAMEHLAK
jgi:hypothetical protein